MVVETIYDDIIFESLNYCSCTSKEYSLYLWMGILNPHWFILPMATVTLQQQTRIENCAPSS